MWDDDDDDDIGEVGGGGGVGVGVGVGGAAEERWDVLLETRTREEGAVGEARSRITRRAPRRQKWLQSPQEELRRSVAAAASCVKKQNKKNNINQQRIKSKRWRKKKEQRVETSALSCRRVCVVWSSGSSSRRWRRRWILLQGFPLCFLRELRRIPARSAAAQESDPVRSVRPSVRPDLSRWFLFCFVLVSYYIF